MNSRRTSNIVCAGVGNSSVQIGVYSRDSLNDTGSLPRPIAHYSFSIVDSFSPVDSEIDYQGAEWFVASVNPPSARQLQEWAEQCHEARSFHILSNTRFAIPHCIQSVERVGSDRLAAAVAANRIRLPQRPIVFIDAGTALTINSISQEGVFLGGAILPGLGASLRALAGQTEQLPLVKMDLKMSDKAPRPIGDHTEAAIRAGVYWGLVGAARELIQQAARILHGQPQVVVTGGFGPWLARELENGAQYEQSLVLSGIAITAANGLLSD